jgi:stage V sporulation protein SpoVS
VRHPARFAALLAPLALAACAEVQAIGTSAIQQRRMMNDLQARFTLAATCDISLGSYFRELSELERHYVGLVCGGVLPPLSAPPATTP